MRGKPDLERPGRHRGQRIRSKDRAASTCGPTLTRFMIGADVGVAIVTQTIYLAETNLKSKRPFRALPLTPEHRQLRLHWCQARSMWNVTDWQKVVFSDESRFVLGTVYGCGGALVNGTIPLTLHFVTLPAQLV
ncbi:HTH_Tnp_Tc3_2 domain-containing protein [Trichonephila clavipes]|nr:HTH_Tnp_Tc3_2 domain-containing protein [Trichonephila clavipes]